MYIKKDHYQQPFLNLTLFDTSMFGSGFIIIWGALQLN